MWAFYSLKLELNNVHPARKDHGTIITTTAPTQLPDSVSSHLWIVVFSIVVDPFIFRRLTRARPNSLCLSVINIYSTRLLVNCIILLRTTLSLTPFLLQSPSPPPRPNYISNVPSPEHLRASFPGSFFGHCSSSGQASKPSAERSRVTNQRRSVDCRPRPSSTCQEKSHTRPRYIPHLSLMQV